MLVNLDDIKKIAIGSLFLGGGGGGDIREGLAAAKRALELGEVQIVPLSEIRKKDGVILPYPALVLPHQIPLIIQRTSTKEFSN